MNPPDEENALPSQELPAPATPDAAKPLDQTTAPEIGFAPPGDLEAMGFTPFPSSLPADEPAPAPSPRRRKRAPRLIERPAADEINLWLESMAGRAAPTLDFFVFALLAGGIMGIGYLLDVQAVLLLGVLIAPILAPWMGAVLATAIGEWRFFFQSVGSVLVALLMVFLTGMLAGLASRIWQPHTFDQAFQHSHLWPADLLVLLLGTIALTFAFIQGGEKPIVASILVTYELFLPASAAGFGLGSNVEGLWPQALVIFLIHLAISLVLALIVFYYMGFRPLDTAGYVLAMFVVVLGLAIAAGFTGLEMLSNLRTSVAPPTMTATATASATSIPTTTAVPVKPATATPRPTQPTQTPSPTRAPNTPTLSLVTPTPVATFPSPTMVPTPIYGRVQSKGDGAVIRTEPGGSAITTVQNGYLVEILPEPPVVYDGALWVHVIIRTAQRDINGWVLYELIVTATPSVASP